MSHMNTLCVHMKSPFDPQDPSGRNLEVSLNPVHSATECKFIEVETDFLQNNLRNKSLLTKI